MSKCNNNRLISFLIEPKFRIYRHLLFWLYVFAFFITPTQAEAVNPLPVHTNLIWITYFMLMFYGNMYLLIPAFLYKSKYAAYMISLLIMIIGMYVFVSEITNSLMNGYSFIHKRPFGNSLRELFVTVHMIVLMVFASTSIKLFQRWVRDNNRINELEKSSLQLELRELKNQINPHFLFNMLNNVKVLVRKDPEKASVVIMKLSDFLRHQLYGNSRQSVLLTSEIQFLNDFMELEKIRRDVFHLSLRVNNNSSDTEMLTKLMLPPNLFIPFVENAVKHSNDPDLPSEVSVLFDIFDDKIVFTCVNTKPAEPLPDTESGGLGLMNISRRLELLYGGNYSLETKVTQQLYTVTLTLPL